ncbi:zinc-ribbon domain-containing protein [[Eubacterium] cellulosolvens]
MICPNCGNMISEGRTSCPSCGTVVSDLGSDDFYQPSYDQQSMDYQQPSYEPQPRAPVDPRRLCVGKINNAYISAGDYYNVFFFQDGIIMAKLGSLTDNRAIGALVGNWAQLAVNVSTMKTEKDKLQYRIIKDDIKKVASKFYEMPKELIQKIKLKKHLTDCMMDIEMSAEQDATGNSKPNYVNFNFAKKEFENVKLILNNWFADKLVN